MTSAINRTVWVRRYRPAPEAAVRLLCLPHAGGSASYYLPMARALAPDADVLAAQFPGRQDRYAEPPSESIRELAERIVEAVGGDDDRPLALFGHSMGAVVAHEAALRLEEAGRAPVRLFVSGRRAPSTTRDRRNLHRASDAELLKAVRALDGTGGQVFEDEELLQLVLPALRGDYTALETYEPRPGDRLSCPVTVLTGDADPVTSVADAGAWADHTDGPTEVCVFPGGHFYLDDRPGEVVDVVRRHLGL